MASEWDEYWSSTRINFDIMEVSAKKYIFSYDKHFGFSENDITLDFGAGRSDMAFNLKDTVKLIY